MREGEWQGDCDHRGDKLCGLGRGERGGHGQSVRTRGQVVALKSRHFSNSQLEFLICAFLSTNFCFDFFCYLCPHRCIHPEHRTDPEHSFFIAAVAWIFRFDRRSGIFLPHLCVGWRRIYDACPYWGANILLRSSWWTRARARLLPPITGGCQPVQGVRLHPASTKL